MISSAFNNILSNIYLICDTTTSFIFCQFNIIVHNHSKPWPFLPFTNLSLFSQIHPNPIFFHSSLFPSFTLLRSSSTSSLPHLFLVFSQFSLYLLSKYQFVLLDSLQYREIIFHNLNHSHYIQISSQTYLSSSSTYNYNSKDPKESIMHRLPFLIIPVIIIPFQFHNYFSFFPSSFSFFHDIKIFLIIPSSFSFRDSRFTNILFSFPSIGRFPVNHSFSAQTHSFT